MTGHPLDDYREILKGMTFTTAQLETAEGEGEGAGDLDGRFADIGGVLTEVKSKATKKGDLMAFATLEDMTGQVECLIFPRVYEKYQALLTEDAAVVISGKISVREEESPKLLAERVTRLQEWKGGGERGNAPARQENGPGKTDAQRAKDAAKKLFLRLGRKDMERISAMLALFPGEVPVYLHIPEEKMTLLSPKENWCSGDERCLRALRDELGESNVVMK